MICLQFAVLLTKDTEVVGSRGKMVGREMGSGRKKMGSVERRMGSLVPGNCREVGGSSAEEQSIIMQRQKV